MSGYTIEDIKNDFKLSTPVTSMANIRLPGSSLLIATATILLKQYPNNQARNFAISHLLQAASLMDLSIVQKINEEPAGKN